MVHNIHYATNGSQYGRSWLGFGLSLGFESFAAGPYIPSMHSTGYASCRAYAEKARIAATRTGDPSLRDHFTEVAEMWDLMAASILKSGVDPNLAAVHGLDTIRGGRSA